MDLRIYIIYQMNHRIMSYMITYVINITQAYFLYKTTSALDLQKMRPLTQSRRTCLVNSFVYYDPVVVLMDLPHIWEDSILALKRHYLG